MANCIIERIMQAIAAALRSGPSWATVERPALQELAQSPSDGLIELICGAADAVEDAPYGYVAWEQEIYCDIYIRPSDADTTEPETTLLNRAADVAKVLRATPTWSGLAYDTVIQAKQPFWDRGSGFWGLRLIAEVHYRHSEDDPYSATP